jgi:hypothetical protein
MTSEQRDFATAIAQKSYELKQIIDSINLAIYLTPNLVPAVEGISQVSVIAKEIEELSRAFPISSIP